MDFKGKQGTHERSSRWRESGENINTGLPGLRKI